MDEKTMSEPIENVMLKPRLIGDTDLQSVEKVEEGVRSKFSVDYSREKQAVSPKIGPDPDFFNRPLEPHRAIELRAAGYNYRQIAERLGVSASTAHRYVKKEIMRQRSDLAESREDMRDLDLTKLECVERRLMQGAKDGDWQAVKLLFSSIELRRAYMRELPRRLTLRPHAEKID